MRNPSSSSAMAKIKKAGALLVFPIKDKPAVPSLWSSFYPNEPMTWDWSQEGDQRVPSLWHLRTQLSMSGEVVYSKWFKNRGTFFSLELFTALLSLVSSKDVTQLGLSEDALNIYSILNDDSPLASKDLKQRCDLAGRENNARFERAMKELWRRFLIVGYGEIDEGGYPSLAVGSSQLLFEDAFDASRALSNSHRNEIVTQYISPQSEFYLQYLKLEREMEIRLSDIL